MEEIIGSCERKGLLTKNSLQNSMDPGKDRKYIDSLTNGIRMNLSRLEEIPSNDVLTFRWK